MRKYNFNEHYFDNIDCQEKAYWLGFFAADGYNHQSKGYIFNITGMEEPLRIMQMHLIDNVGVVDNGLKSRSSTSAVTIHYSGRKVCKRILDYLYKDAVIYLQRKYNKYQEYCISAE